MTNTQAQQEARKRWGPTGAVEKYGKARSTGHRFYVGYVAFGMFFNVCGSGHSWDEAFKAAEGKTRVM